MGAGGQHIKQHVLLWPHVRTPLLFNAYSSTNAPFQRNFSFFSLKITGLILCVLINIVLEAGLVDIIESLILSHNYCESESDCR